MSAVARKNGWRGFDGIGERVDGGWLYRCDGMPRLMGCGAEVVVPRRYSRVGVKPSGWLACYGREDPGEPGDDGKGNDGKGNDLDVVLTFCPSCRAHVEAFEAAR